MGEEAGSETATVDLVDAPLATFLLSFPALLVDARRVVVVGFTGSGVDAGDSVASGRVSVGGAVVEPDEIWVAFVLRRLAFPILF